jgi:hypothetical protein
MSKKPKDNTEQQREQDNEKNLPAQHLLLPRRFLGFVSLFLDL